MLQPSSLRTVAWHATKAQLGRPIRSCNRRSIRIHKGGEIQELFQNRHSTGTGRSPHASAYPQPDSTQSTQHGGSDHFGRATLKVHRSQCRIDHSAIRLGPITPATHSLETGNLLWLACSSSALKCSRISRFRIFPVSPRRSCSR